MKIACGFLPVALVDKVVPVRDLVVDRATGRAGFNRTRAVAIRDATIHATCRLVAHFLFRKRKHEFTPGLNALCHRGIVAILALDFEKAGYLTHACYSGADGQLWFFFLQ